MLDAIWRFIYQAALFVIVKTFVPDPLLKVVADIVASSIGETPTIGIKR